MPVAAALAALPPHRRIVPPAYFLAALLLMLLLHRYAPLMRFNAAPLQWSGAALIAAGVALASWGAVEFRRAGTPVRPFLESTAMVTTGPFRRTRNPMYLGMLAVLTGAWLALGSLSPAAVVAAFFLLIRQWFIRHEEALLAARFGELYGDYCRRVRRWL
jgi:protein-S-isoprenylcysteine O-methyltransferase Ste14